MSNWGIKFCPECGSRVKVSKRKTDYDPDTGELRGYYLDLVCGNWINRVWWRHPWVWWGYEEAVGVLKQGKRRANTKTRRELAK